MRMEFSRMSGHFVSQRPWRVDRRSLAILFDEARDALASFYEGDEYSVWTKIEFFPNAPEQVHLIDSGGAVVIEYSLVDLLADSGALLGPTAPARGIPARLFCPTEPIDECPNATAHWVNCNRRCS